MNNICKLFCALVALYVIPLVCSAQVSSGHVVGIVADSATNKPAAFITVAIKKDSVVLKTLVTA